MKTDRASRVLARILLAAFFLVAMAALAPAQGGVWTSYGPDAGWITDLAIADSIAYAATINGVFLSHDRGATWRLSGLEGHRIGSIAARSGANVVLAARAYYGDLFVSRDRGESWEYFGSQANIVAIDPNDLSTIYRTCGGERLEVDRLRLELADSADTGVRRCRKRSHSSRARSTS